MPFPQLVIAGRRALVLDAKGPLLRGEDAARELIQETFFTDIRLIVVPVERLDPDFFVLRTGVAGEFVQKLVQYAQRLVIIGDVSGHAEASDAFRDWVREVNRGPDVWFLPTLRHLEERLGA
jgi:hypothetical protein